MPDDLDHEVIDSPSALFRHLYEAHGLVEALDLDPETAPLQFWLRRHAELERAATRPAARERTATAPPPPPAGGGPRVGWGPAAGGRSAMGRAAAAGVASGVGEGSGGGGSTAEGGAPAAGASPPHRRANAGEGTGPGEGSAAEAVPPAPTRRSGGAGGMATAGSGLRFRPFADPVVEALAVALVGRGLDERLVRRGLSTFPGRGGRHGEEAVRSTFIAPMLEALAAHLTGNAADPAPPPTVPKPVAARPEPPGRAEPPSDGHESWVAEPLGSRGGGPEPEVDFMAIADVLQERHRSRRGGRREATTGRTGSRTPAAAPPPLRTPPARPPKPQEPDDDYMALADALQLRPGHRPH